MKAAFEDKMYRCLSICLVLSFFSTGLAYSQTDTKAATRNTWQAAGLFSMYYQFPIDEGDYVEEGILTLDINPRALWFPIDGLGVGVDANFFYLTGHFTDLNLGFGPYVAYYLRRSEQQIQLMPYVGCSFQYLLNDVDPGASETGWRLKLGLGISPVFGRHLTVPVEFGYMAHHISSDYGSISYSQTTSRIYLECGIGAFLWPKNHP